MCEILDTSYDKLIQGIFKLIKVRSIVPFSNTIEIIEMKVYRVL